MPGQKRKPSGRKCPGSMTVFFSLTLLLILSFIFSLLEAARVRGISNLTQQNLQMRLESAFGEYNRPLWKNYGLLFLDGSYGTGVFDIGRAEGHMMEEGMQQKGGTSFLRKQLQNIEITGYALACDSHGSVFQSQACEAAKRRIAGDVAGAVREQLETGSRLLEESGTLKEKWSDASKALEEAEKQTEKNSPGENTLKENSPAENYPRESGSAENHTEESGISGTVQADSGKKAGNPIPYVENLRKSGVLGLVVQHPEELSQKGVSLQDNVENREKYCGNLPEESSGIVDKLLFLQYLNYYLSCKTGMEEQKGIPHALDYELEYCICGEESDVDNLEETVKKLLLIREAGNFAALMKSPAKRAEALEIAVAVAGATGLAPLVKAVQIGILLAWSFVESILDVRCLLAGGKIALIKKETEFQCSFGNVGNLLDTENEAREEEHGLEYREYLIILLLAGRQETTIYRTMDVLEKNIRLATGNENLRMDAMIQKVKAEALYTAEPLFPSLLTLAKVSGKAYTWRIGHSFSYY